jgi:hypothetical protein
VDGGTYVGIAHSLERVGLVLPVITKVSKETNRLIKKAGCKICSQLFYFSDVAVIFRPKLMSNQA